MIYCISSSSFPVFAQSWANLSHQLRHILQRQLRFPSSRLCDTNLRTCQRGTLLIVAGLTLLSVFTLAPTTIDEIWTAFLSVFTFPQLHSCFSGWKRPRARCLSLLYAASRHEVIRIVDPFFSHFEECNGVKVTSPVIMELVISWW